MDRPSLDRRAVVCSALGPNSTSKSAARPWRCRACGALLGMEHGGELHIKYKEVQHWVRGVCRHACRRCGTMNTRLTPTAAPAADSAGLPAPSLLPEAVR